MWLWGPWQRFTTLGGILLTLGGLASLPEDLRRPADDIWSAVLDNPIGAVLAALGLLFIIGANMPTLAALLGFQTDRLLQSKIEHWLDRQGYSIAHPKLDDDRWAFVIMATSPADGMTVTIDRVKGEVFIMYRAGLQINDDHASLMRNAAKMHRYNMYSDIKIELMRSGIAFNVDTDQDRIKAEYAISFDIRTQEMTFFEGLLRVRIARQIVNEVVAKYVVKLGLSQSTPRK